MTDDDLTAEIAALEARADAVRDQIESLHAELRRIVGDIDAARDLLVEQTEDDAALVALAATNGSAAAKLEERIRGIHPYFYSYSRFHPLQGPGDGLDTADLLYGPHVSLMRPNLDARKAESLAVALVEFAERFCPVVPDGGEYPGMVRADILDEDCSETRSYTLWFEPSLDGIAVLVDSSWGRGRDVAAGPLVEIVAKTIEAASQPSDDGLTGW